MKYYQKLYNPINKEKYQGNLNNIFLRSSWEIKFAKFCDINPSIIKWSSEEIVIPYSMADQDGKLKSHRYFVDFKIIVKDKNNKLKTYLIEIKPSAQTKPPVVKKRRTKKYNESLQVFAKNCAKWDKAAIYCRQRGWEFKIITENELGI